MESHTKGGQVNAGPRPPFTRPTRRDGRTHHEPEPQHVAQRDMSDTHQREILIGAIEKSERERVEIRWRKDRHGVFLDLRIARTDQACRLTGKGFTVRPDRLPELLRLLELAKAQAHAVGLIG